MNYFYYIIYKTEINNYNLLSIVNIFCHMTYNILYILFKIRSILYWVRGGFPVLPARLRSLKVLQSYSN